VNEMPILIDELLVEAEPPRARAEAKGDTPSQKARQPGQADKMLELAIVADRHHRLEVD
jgi:hypothetical protein